MNEQELFLKHKYRLINLAIGSSAMRQQGTKNAIQEIRNVLYDEDIEKFKMALHENKFLIYLDDLTNFIFEKLHASHKLQWGAVRKALNLYFRDIFYSSYFCKKIMLDQSLISQLEIPLDSFTGKGIIEDYSKIANCSIKWTTIKSLTPQKSKQVQEMAQMVNSTIYKLPAIVDLDLVYWRRPNIDADL